MSSPHRLSVLSSHRANAHHDTTQRSSSSSSSSSSRSSFTQQQQERDTAPFANNRTSYEFRLAQYNAQVEQASQQEQRLAQEMAALELQKQQYDEQQSYLFQLLQKDPKQYHDLMQDQLRMEQEARDQLETQLRPSLPFPSPPAPRALGALHTAPPNRADVAPPPPSGAERSRFSHMLQASAHGPEAGSAVLNRKLALKREQVHALSTRVAVAMHQVAEQPQGTLK